MKYFLSFLFSTILLSAEGQVTGVPGNWFGVGKVHRKGAYNSYLCEMNLTKKSMQVSGNFHYYFGTSQFDVPLKGVYLPATKTVDLLPIRLINFMARDSNSADCEMEGSLSMYINGTDTTLVGQLNPVHKYRNFCPVIDIALRKEQPMVNTPGNTIALVEKPAAQKPVKKEIRQEDKEPVQKNRVEKPAPLPNTGIAAKTTTPKPAAGKDSIAKPQPATESIAATPLPSQIKKLPAENPVTPVKTTNSAPDLKPQLPLSQIQLSVEKLNQRAFVESSPVIDVDADSLKVALYDNGEVDNDSISVFYNRQPVVVHQLLSGKPIELSLPLATDSITELSMYAENLGSIPPNTAICIVHAGTERYVLYMSSDFTKNGTVKFRKKSLKE